MNVVGLAALIILGALRAMASPRLAIRSLSYIALLFGAFTLWNGSLGLPRPVGWHSGYRGQVLAFRLNEPHAVFLWLRPKGAAGPLSLRLPWSEGKAKQLVAAAKAAKAGHGRLMANLGATGHKTKAKGPKGEERATLHRMSPVFYGAPVPGLPPKALP